MFKNYEFILNHISQWSFFLKISILLACNIILIFLGYWLMIKPGYQYLYVLRADEQVLKELFVKDVRQVALIQKYKYQSTIRQAELAVLKQQLANKNEPSGLLDELTQNGIKAGLTFELFVPQPVVTHEFYLELPIKITLVGTYMQLMTFINQIAQMKRIVTLHDFILAREEHHASDLLVMNVIAKIYQ